MSRNSFPNCTEILFHLLVSALEIISAKVSFITASLSDVQCESDMLKENNASYDPNLKAFKTFSEVISATASNEILRSPATSSAV
jgi:hypothetical protein